MSTNLQSITARLSVYDAVHQSIEQHRPMSVVYATGGVIVKERVVRPERIAVGKHGDLIICSEDSLRPGVVSLRIDRVVAVSGAVEDRY